MNLFHQVMSERTKHKEWNVESSFEMLHFVRCYMNQNKNTLENAQYGLEIIFNSLNPNGDNNLIPL